MRTRALAASLLTAVLLLPAVAGASDTAEPAFDDVVAAVLALPYNPAAQPAGPDTAFDDDDYPAAFPLTDLAGGACCTGPVHDQPPLADLAPPFAEFPEAFQLIELGSYDGTPLHAWAALRAGAPGVVVMHGFNTNGKYSVVRYAAFLHANGYSVIAPDHRDMGREWARGGSWHPDGTRHGQTFGWKEAQDLLVAAEWLRARDVDRIGVLGLSEGAQNTILALGIDHDRVIDAALTFSAPADQRSLIQRSPATTAALLATVVGNPDVCGYLTGVGARPEFAATPNFMLRHDSAVDTLDGLIGGGVAAPALHLYTNDDTLVPPWNATALASRTNAMAEQHTVLLASGNHAYFADRWWTQMAALTWFGAWLDPAGAHTTATATVTQTPGGPPAADQQLDLSAVTRADGDAELRRTDACASGDPVGPTADLEVSGAAATFTLDGRRSYSGWDGHEIASWTIDPGDGAAPVSGSDVTAARVEHRYAPGTYTAAVTVTDDTGRTATATATITVDAGPPDGSAPRAVGGGWLGGAGSRKVNFGFNVRAGTDGGLSGHLNLRDGAAGAAVQIDIVESLGGVAAGCGAVEAGPEAVQFTGTGTHNGAAASFRVCVADLGEPGNTPAGGADLFYLECTAGCSYATGDHTADDVIDGGNVQVRGASAAGAEGEAAASSGDASVLILEPLLVVGAAPEVLTVTAFGADGEPVHGAAVMLVSAVPGGVLATAEGVTGPGGLATFPAAPASGGVEYLARSGSVTSNAVEVGGPG